jgi:hypothetical protein
MVVISGSEVMSLRGSFKCESPIARDIDSAPELVVARDTC